MVGMIVVTNKGKAHVSSITDSVPGPVVHVRKAPMLRHRVRYLERRKFSSVVVAIDRLNRIVVSCFNSNAGISPIANVPFKIGVRCFIRRRPLKGTKTLFHVGSGLASSFLLLGTSTVFSVSFLEVISCRQAGKTVMALFARPGSRPCSDKLIVTSRGKTILR